MKKLDIIIPKQDYLNLPIVYKVNGEVSTLGETDLMFFSVKSNLVSDEYLIQKSLGNGITYDATEEKYYLEIDSNDTINLNMNDTYLYDLTIYYEGTKPMQKLYGQFKIGPKVTLNEVI